MSAIHFDLAAAQDALARSDEGVKALPGDDFLRNAYEGYLQQEQLRRDDEEYARERAEWLETACPACDPDGKGSVCDTHWDSLPTPELVWFGASFGLVAE